MNKWLDFINHYFYILVPAVLVVFYFYATEPLDKRNDRLQNQLAEATQLHDWMQQQAPNIGQSPSPDSGKALTTVEVLSRIEQLARRHQIIGQMKNLRPLNKQSVRLWMKAVDFHRFVSLLDELLQDRRLSASKLNIAAIDQPGKADIDLTLNLR